MNDKYFCFIYTVQLNRHITVERECNASVLEFTCEGKCCCCFQHRWKSNQFYSTFLSNCVNMTRSIVSYLVFSTMDSAKHSDVCWIPIYRIEFCHIVMVRLGFLCEHRLRGHHTDTKLVLASSGNKYIPGLHIGRCRWQAGQTHWAVGPVGWTLWPWTGFIHGATDSILFV